MILRDKPTMQGRQLALMKEKEEVLVQRDDGPEETLFGRKSRWFEVKYKGIQGYAFGGFLEFTGKQNSVTKKTDVQKELPKTITNSIGMEFVLIPAGEFLMGCSDGDSECYENEKPQHKVKITKPFYMGKYEVTQGQWKKVMGKNPSRFKNCGADCPVETVSWNDTQTFIEKLCSQERTFLEIITFQKCKYRLPTEAEWEYAARAGTNTIWYGNLDEIAWYDKNSGNTTHPVGKKRPNAFGLYDMLGNVEEWVEDWFSEDYYKSSPEFDPKGKYYWTRRGFRGGCWLYTARFVRSSSRNYSPPELRHFNVGFRLVLSP
ncbi:MAG TPA: formylglycine-generating enzyme family protein [Leptospiraceae bacterium]|nr:formylglycine-generating enzyme family protein [Leptospiraceae bacterium]